MTRYVVTIGVGEYLEAQHALPGVRDDVRRVAKLFVDLGYQPVLPELEADPAVDTVRRGLHRWLIDPGRRSDDVVVVYYAGHGAVRSGGHYLLCADSDSRMLSSTALATEDIAKMLEGSRVQHLLVVLDCCFAGAGAGELAAVAGRLARVREIDESRGGGLWWVAAARSAETAQENVFVDALVNAVDRGPAAGERQEFIDPTELVKSVNDELIRRRCSQRARLGVSDASGVPPFFPNSRYRPGLPPEGIDLETQRRVVTEQAFREHFGPKSRGVEVETEPGFYFSGRRQVLAELVGWLSDPRHDQRIRVVTGAPGSGKSAVLGHLLASMEADRRHLRDLSPARPDVRPAWSVDVAVHGRGKTVDEIVTQIARAAGVEVAGSAELVTALAARTAPLTVVIDALDEVGSAPGFHEARLLIAALVRPLGMVPSVRLLLGSRPHLIPALGASSVVIDLDAAPYAAIGDVAVYTERLLLAEDDPTSRSPYRGQPELARRIAQAVARKAYPSFLVARTIARGLIHASPVDTGSPDWWQRLPSEAGAAFDGYLALLGEHAPKARRLLTPLAFAYGAGLPWGMWTALSEAMSGQPCGDADLMWLLEVAGSFVVEATQDGRSVYRLYHEALAEHLRATHLMPAHEVHARITDALCGTVPVTSDHGRPDWTAAHPYVRQHLAVHAASAGRIDALLADPQFVLTADLDRLLPAARTATTRQGNLVAFAVERAAGQMRIRPNPERAAYLQLAARKCGATAFADRLRDQGPPMPWSALWASVQPVTPHRIVGHHQTWIHSLAQARVDGVPVAVTLADDEILTWDLRHGTPIGRLGPPTRNHDGAPVITGTTRDGQVIAVTGGTDGTAQRWDLRTAAPIGPPVPLFDGPVFRLAGAVLADDTRVVLAAGWSGALAVWALDTGHRIGTIETGHRGYNAHLPPPARPAMITAVTTLRLPDGRTIVITAGMDGTVRVFDLDSGRHLRTIGPSTEKSNSIVELAAACVDGSPLVALRLQYGTHPVEVWDVLAGDRLHQVDTSDRCRAIDVLRLSVPLLVISIESGDILVHDLATGARSGPPLRGHEGSAHVLVSSCDDSGTVGFLSAGNDRTVRLWKLDSNAGGGNQGHQPVDLQPVSGPGCELAASTDSQGGVLLICPPSKPRGARRSRKPDMPGTRTLLRWDLLSGNPVEPPVRNTPMAGALAVTVLAGDRRVMIVNGGGGPPQAWEIATGRHLGDLGVSAGFVTTIPPDGGPALAVVRHNGELQGWNLDMRQPLGPRVPVEDGHRLVAAAHLPRHGLVALVSNAGGFFKDPMVVTALDLLSGRQLARISAENRTRTQVAAAPTADGRLLAVILSPETPLGPDTYDEVVAVQVWDVLAGQQLGTLMDGSDAFQIKASAMADGRVIAVIADHGGRVHIFDLDRPASPITLELDATTWSVHIVADHDIVIFNTEAGLVAIRLQRPGP